MPPKVTIALSQHPLQFTPSPYSSSISASATTLKAFPTTLCNKETVSYARSNKNFVLAIIHSWNLLLC